VDENGHSTVDSVLVATRLLESMVQHLTNGVHFTVRWLPALLLSFVCTGQDEMSLGGRPNFLITALSFFFRSLSLLHGVFASASI